MNSSARLDDLAQRFQEDPRRYFAPLANEYRKSGQPGRAAELCRAQLAEHPGHLSGHVVLALALHDLGERAEARRAYEEALRLDPENVLVLRSLGDLARESGEPELARDWYERAMGVDPRDPEVARRLAALENEQAQAPIAASDLSFTEALAVAEQRHRDADDADDAYDAYGDAPAGPADTERAGETPAPVETEEVGEFTAGFFATAPGQPALGESVVEPPAVDVTMADAPVVDVHEADTQEGADWSAPQLTVDDVTMGDLAVRDETLDHATIDQTAVDEAADDGSVDEVDVIDPSTPGATATEPDITDASVVDPDVVDVSFADVNLADANLVDANLVDARLVDARRDDASLAEPGDVASADAVGGMERLFSELEPITDDQLEAEQDGLLPSAEPAEVLGADLAPADGAPAVPDFPPMPELGELPPLEVFYDVGELEEVPVEGGASEAGASEAEAVEAAPAGADEAQPPLTSDEAQPPLAGEDGPMPLVADEWTMSLDSIGFEPEPAEYSATSSAPDPGAAFVTETMAQLYLQQGLTQEALGVYRQLAGQRPDEQHLRDRVSELESRLEAERIEDAGRTAASHAGSEDEPPAASWLERLARARPTVLGLPLVAEPGADAPGSAEPGIAEELEEAEELVIPPAAAADEHEVSAFEWAIPDSGAGLEEGASARDEAITIAGPDTPDAEGATGPTDTLDGVDEAKVEGAADAADAADAVSGHAPAGDAAAATDVGQTEAPGLPDDDPWVFEGERMQAAGFSGAWEAVAEANNVGTSDVGARDEPDEGPAAGSGDEVTLAGPESGPPGGREVREVGPPQARQPANLDELFARPVAITEEQAAGALAAATVSMQDDPEVNAQLGEAVAEDPSSLLHLLRGTPRSVATLRQGASFSFDQFFRVDDPLAPEATGRVEGATGAEQPGHATPADAPKDGGTEGGDDLADFHAWLSGLSDP